MERRRPRSANCYSTACLPAARPRSSRSRRPPPGDRQPRSDALMAHILTFEGIEPRIHPDAWIAPTATIIGNVVVEAGASIWFGAVLRGDDPEREIRVGARTSVQDNCVLHVSAEGPT